MDFSNARLLDYSRQNKFLNSEFRFGADTSYSIEGYLLDLQNDAGVSGVLEASEFFRTGLRDYQDISLNGLNFGKGRVTNFSVNESDFIKYTTYQLDIQGFESGNLYNLSGEHYDGLDSLTGFVEASHLLENFSEDFSFSRSDDAYSYTHSLDIKYASGDGIQLNPIDRAKNLAHQILTESSPPFGFIDSQVSGLYGGAKKEYFSENIDQINGSYSVEKSFNSLNPSGDYSLTLKHSFNLGENGITNISEDATVKTHLTPKKSTLKTAVETEIANSYDRCLVLSNTYGTAPISGSAASLSQSLNNFEGVGSYSISYTNDPSFGNTYIWKYSHQIDKNGTFYEASENGDIQGLGSSSQTKYNRALAQYSIAKAGISTRTDTFYQDNVDNPSTLNLISTSENKNQFRGNISYQNTYSDEPSRNVNGLKKLEISVEDAPPVDFINKFEILGYKELVQSIGTTTLGQRSLNMNLQGYRDATLDSILTIADSSVNNYIPDGNDVFIGDAKYSFDENNKLVNLNVLWSYNRESRGVETI